jgi:DNA polymerase III subunit beta
MIKGEVVAQSQAFMAAVKWTARFLDSRPAAPIQGGLLLDTEGGRLSIVGYNEALTARAAVEADGDGVGQAVVSGRLLAALAATFPAKPVTIVSESETTVDIQVGSWHGTLPAMNAAEFAEPPAPPVTIGTVRGDDLAQAIRRVAVARAVNDDAALRWHLLLIEFGEGRAVAMATDSYRAARLSMPYVGQGGHRVLVHSATVLEVAESFAGPDEVHVAVSDTALGFASPTRAVVMRQTIDEGYPYEPVRKLFRAEHPERARVRVTDLHGPLKRAGLIRDKEGPISVRFRAGAIALAANSSQLDQKGVEVIEAEYDGPEQTLKFNPGYFAEALREAPGDEVDIALRTDVVTGVVLTVPGNDEWRHLLMPIKE